MKIEVVFSALTGGFVTDTNRAAKEAQKAMREVRDSVNEAAGGIKEGLLESVRALTGLSAGQLGLGALAAGLGEVTKQAIETGDKLNKMAQKVGVGVDSLQGLVYAAQLSDVGIESLGSGLEKFNKAISAAAGGSKEQAAAFAAIGVSLNDANGKLKPTAQLVSEVSDKFKGFTDDANKTALAMALFGKSGAELIPFLNTGSEEIKKMAAEAKALGGDFAAIAKPSEEFNDNITRMKYAAVGFGVDIAKELLPVLIEAEERILDFIKSARENGTFQALASAIGVVVSNLDTLAVVLTSRLAIGAAISAFETLTVAITSTAGAAAFAEGALALLGGPVGILAIAAGLMYQFSTTTDIATQATDHLRDAIKKADDATNESLPGQKAALRAAIDRANADLKAADAALTRAEAEQKLANANLPAPGATFTNGGGAFTLAAGMADSKVDSLKQHIADLRKEIFSANESLSILAINQGIVGEKAKQATPNFNGLAKAMTDAEKQAEKLAKDGVELASFLDQLSSKTADKHTKAWAEYGAAIEKINALSAKFIKDGMDQARVQQFISDATQLATRSLREQTDANENLLHVFGDLDTQIAQETQTLGLNSDQRDIVNATIKAQAEISKALEGVMGPLTQAQQDEIDAELGRVQSLELLKQETKRGEEAARDWQNVWKTAGDGVASTFASVLVNGGSMFDGLVNLAKQTVQAIIEYFAKLAVINPILNAIFGGGQSAGFNLLPTLGSAIAGGGGVAGGSTGISSIFSASSWVNAGKNLWSGFSTLWNGSGVDGVGGNFMGNFVTDNGTTTWTNSGLGSAIGIAGGLYAGYNRYQSAGGGLAGLAGGAAYGAGTYALAGGLGSLAAGGGFAAGVSGAFAAVPVVGWIALAAMAIDALSGGNLFGTAAKPTGNTTQNILLGQDSASVMNQYETKKKEAFFGGNSYSWKDFAATDDQKAAADALLSGILKSVTAGADALGGKVGTLITGSFYQKFDKDGKVLDAYSTVLGQKFKETMQQFAERVTAENLLALLPAAQNASKIADQWRASADALLDGTSLLLSAQVDINKGIGLLGDNGSLADITKEVQKLQLQSESLSQTYSRLQTEQQTFKTILDTLGLTTGKTGADFLEFTDKLVTMAGGLQNLQSAWDGYYNAYYSDSERQANALKAMQKAVTDTFQVIGEDPAESMAKFRADFEAALPTLTPEQVLQWLAGANALANLTAYMNQAADAATKQAQADAAAQAAAMKSYSDFVAQFDPKTLGITAFENSLIGLHGTLTDNIQKANDLAKAAGMAGASQQDIAKIITASAQAGVDALKQFEDQVSQLAAKLYGTNIDQLTKQLTDLQAADKARLAGMDGYTAEMLRPYFAQQEAAIQKQIDDANSQAEALQRLSDATSLLSDLGQIGSITHQSLDDLAKQFSIPLDKFASDLGLSTDDLNKQFQQAEMQAQAALQANDYLRQILNVLSGRAADTPVNPHIPIDSRSIGAGPGGRAQPASDTQLLQSIHVILSNILQSTNNVVVNTKEGSRAIVGAVENTSVRAAAIANSGPRSYISNRNTRGSVPA